ncbi:MAG: ABC transporter ATP-binding protein [Clostridiales bacterium]|jgi:oligopeptide transport system ATP-binding protein|nr:ABC transporter ATP-binding protein [Clostridiales bacterium]
MPLLSVENLRISFFTPAGEVKAVNGVSYELDEGEVLGIVGESGSGKSVSVSALMKLLTLPGRVIGGSMTFQNQDIESLSPKAIRKIRGKDISMIFQDPMTSLNPVYSIGNQLRETIRLHTDMNRARANERAVQMLNLVGINNPERRLKQYPHELSGGMRQRVMIAMALACSPKLLIADEPTTSLDVTIQAQILDLMKRMREETGTAIILITHDLGIVTEICSKVIIMYAGRIIESGSVEDIYYRTSHPYTKGLLDCLPRNTGEKRVPLRPIEGTPVDLLDMPVGCGFASRCTRCMKVCLQKAPPDFTVGDAHISACWLHTVKQPGGVS